MRPSELPETVSIGVPKALTHRKEDFTSPGFLELSPNKHKMLHLHYSDFCDPQQKESTVVLDSEIAANQILLGKI